MNSGSMRGAFAATLNLAFERGMHLAPNADDKDIGYDHLVSMYQKIADNFSPGDSQPTFDDGKLGRWLGWAQCAVAAAGYATLDDMIALNRKWSNENS